MALIETWRRQDLDSLVQMEYLDGVLFTQDNMANLIGVELYDSGVPYSGGGSVSANVIRSDGGTVAVTGTISGNKASVTLPQACYAEIGPVFIIMKLTVDTTVTTIGSFCAVVYKSTTGAVIDPGTLVSSVQNMIAALEAAVDSFADYSGLLAMIAPTYSTSGTYAVGDYVIYNNGLYRCNTAITSGESWTSGHWTAVKIGNEVSDLKNASDALMKGKTLDFTGIEKSHFAINSSGKWSKDNSQYSCVIPLDGISKVGVIAGANGGVIGFLNTYAPVASESVDFASGYSGRIVLSASEQYDTYVKSGMNYLFVLLTNQSGQDRTPTVNIYGAKTDETLTKQYVPADAKVTGDAVRKAQEYIDSYVSEMPLEYKQVEYLESTGTQYITTGFKPDQDTRVVADFQQMADTGNSASYVFGARSGATSNAFYFGSYGQKYISGFRDAYDNSTADDMKRHTVDMDGGVTKIDGETIYTPESGNDFECYHNMLLFGTSAQNSAIYYGSVRIYGCKVYDDGTLIRDYVPCVRVSDSAPGMYDMVNDTFTGVTLKENTDTPIKVGAEFGMESIFNAIDKVKAELQEEIDAVGAYSTKEYIVTEANRVSEKVRNVQTGKSITFIAISDLHYNIDSQTVKNALQDMRDGIKAIAEQTYIDFYACFGDIIYRTSGATDFEKGRQEIIAVTKLINDCFGNNQQIRMVGNHDPNSETNDYYFTAEYVNAFTGLYSNMIERNEAVPYGAYGIHDFERQKIRLIVLNTSMYGKDSRPTKNGTTYKLGPTQANWLANALDIHEKDNYSEWQIMIFSHVPLDWCRNASSGPINDGALSQYTAILNAYETGGTWGSVNYSGKNAAKLSLYINGHQHAYKIKNIDYWSGYDNPAPSFVRSMKIADLYIPHALPDRNEESMDGEEYEKTAYTAQSTAFEVCTIDPETKTLYAHHYGVGIDMILHYESAAVTGSTTLTTDLTSPAWESNNESIATVSNGTITPVANGNTIIWCKSTTDNCIEGWNINVAL